MPEDLAAPAELSGRTKATRALIRAFLSLAIGALFIVILTVASEQQNAMTELRAKKPELSYIAALRIAEDRQKLISSRNDAEKSREEARSKQIEINRDKIFASTALRLVDAEVSRIGGGIKDCQIGDPKSLDSDAMVRRWNSVSDCILNDGVPQTRRDQFLKLSGEAGSNIPNLTANLSQIENEVEETRNRISSIDREIEALDTKIEDQRVLNTMFSSISEMNKFGPIKVMRLIYLSPNVISILLSFVAGLFGALLLTLILAVYPKNDFDFVSSNSYFDRIFLGGLISIAVFVVIGGGLGVLGAATGVRDGTSNFLTFCAIGILAGMFSDRVAGWLSQQANVFRAAPAPSPAPLPAPAPAP